MSLTIRYGDRITTEVEPLFVSYVGDAVGRRLQRTNKTVQTQAVGPASVRYTDKSGLGGWFWPEEIADMDAVAGRGGIQSIRAAAPDGIRFGNRMRRVSFNPEDD